MKHAFNLPSLSPGLPSGRSAGRPGTTWRLFQSLLGLLVLAITALGLVQFGLLLAAGDALRAAGRAAVQEAAMPQATCRSIAAAARRRLAAAHLADVVDPVRVEINGRPRFGATRPEAGDRVVVTLTLATSAAAPDLLGPLGISLAGRQIQFGLATHIP
jgi:hypothetical protein